MTAVVVVGIGARPDQEADTIVRVVRTIVGDHRIRCLATVDRRAAEAGMTAAAAELGVPVIGYDPTELAAVEVPTPAERATEAIGTPSVAEAGALLACARWCDRPRLLRRKTVIEGITVAIACCTALSGSAGDSMRLPSGDGYGHTPIGVAARTRADPATGDSSGSPS
ncbi:cobalamin biosynthesis protein [Nocardia sp. NPDC052254]|uniref:cobalamin biosynthesis protein n=1 Tax=Nocardia sp. NPDC052254 TaxID=3155681 RepID=UPI0034188788